MTADQTRPSRATLPASICVSGLNRVSAGSRPYDGQSDVVAGGAVWALSRPGDPAQELDVNGVYRFADGQVTSLITDLGRPNGIAFSPDLRTMYVSNTEATRKVVMAYDVAGDGSVSNGRVFVDATADSSPGMPDGLKVDTQGNVYATAPGGVWVITPDGRHLGTIQPPEMATNCAWGDDGRTLYITAETGIYRIKLNATGN